MINSWIERWMDIYTDEFMDIWMNVNRYIDEYIVWSWINDRWIKIKETKKINRWAKTRLYA